MPLDLNKARKYLSDFDFQSLFIDNLGWSNPRSSHPLTFSVKDAEFTSLQVAQLAGVMILEVSSKNGQIPDAKIRATLHKKVSELHYENILIFVD